MDNNTIHNLIIQKIEMMHENLKGAQFLGERVDESTFSYMVIANGVVAIDVKFKELENNYIEILSISNM